MHGQIGKVKDRAWAHRNTGDFYENRAASLERCRRMGNGGIDYDFYHARARRERARFMRSLLRGLAPKLRPLIRPLIAAAIVLAAIWMMPTRAQDCAACAPALSTFATMP